MSLLTWFVLWFQRTFMTQVKALPKTPAPRPQIGPVYLDRYGQPMRPIIWARLPRGVIEEIDVDDEPDPLPFSTESDSEDDASLPFATSQLLADPAPLATSDSSWDSTSSGGPVSDLFSGGSDGPYDSTGGTDGGSDPYDGTGGDP